MCPSVHQHLLTNTCATSRQHIRQGCVTLQLVHGNSHWVINNLATTAVGLSAAVLLTAL
jgi:hypothetical protein